MPPSVDDKKPSPVGEGGPLAVDEVSRQGMPLGKFDEEKANTSSVILANARMPPSPTGEGLEYIPLTRMKSLCDEICRWQMKSNRVG